MSGGKAKGKQPRDTAAKDALLQLQALHHSHREATLLFLMAVREGATDAQIAGCAELVKLAQWYDVTVVVREGGTDAQRGPHSRR